MISLIIFVLSSEQNYDGQTGKVVAICSPVGGA